MEIEPITTPLIIGYYPFRGQVQMLRLICEYLHCPYVDRFFEPEEWKEFKEKEAKHWVIKAIPFLQHEDFVVTGNYAMIIYVMDICDRHDLEGRTLEDKTKMDFMKSKSLKDTMFSLLCNENLTTIQQEEANREHVTELFEKKVFPIVEFHERECVPDNFYLGYLSLVDFGIYEMVNHFQTLFSDNMARFTKLAQIRNRVAAIPEIAAYEASDRCVKEISPLIYFKKLKEEKLKMAREMSTETNSEKAPQ